MTTIEMVRKKEGLYRHTMPIKVIPLTAVILTIPSLSVIPTILRMTEKRDLKHDMSTSCQGWHIPKTTAGFKAVVKGTGRMPAQVPTRFDPGIFRIRTE
jgi:hypothetical protein